MVRVGPRPTPVFPTQNPAFPKGPSRSVVLKLFGAITPRQCYDRSSLPLIPFPFSYVKLKVKITGCLVLVHCICKKNNFTLRNKEFRFRQCSFGKTSKSKHCCFYYKLELKYYFKELLLLESDSLPPVKGFITPTGVITPTLRTTALDCVVISVTLILPTQNPQFPPVVPLAWWVVIRVFPIILLILEHKIKWFLLVFWVLSEKPMRTFSLDLPAFLYIYPNPFRFGNSHSDSLFLHTPLLPVHKNSESDPSEAKQNRLVAKRNDICGNITSRLV